MQICRAIHGAPNATRDNLGRIRVKSTIVGRLTQRLDYAYDSRGRLLTVATGGATTRTYGYDPNGNRNSVLNYVVDGAGCRVGKKVNGALTQGLLYKDQLRVIAELDATGNIASQFICPGENHCLPINDAECVDRRMISKFNDTPYVRDGYNLFTNNCYSVAETLITDCQNACR